eukprot:gene12240-biopygen19936
MGQTAADVDRTRTGRGPHNSKKRTRTGRGPDAGTAVSPIRGRAQGGGGGGVFCVFFLCPGVELETWELLLRAAISPRVRERSPAAQMIQMGAGTSLAFQRLSRDTPSSILSA